jgi:serine/threonine protein kinase
MVVMPNEESAPQQDQTQILKDKQTKLRKRLHEAKRKYDVQGYVPLGEVERILHENSLKSLIRRSKAQISEEDVQKAVSLLLEHQPKEDLTAYRFLRVFATLLYCEHTDYTELAIGYFLDPNHSEWKPPEDHALSSTTSKTDFYNTLGVRSDGFYDHFFARKRDFCALVLKEGARHVVVRKDVALPFSIGHVSMGKGGAGEVYKVKVGTRHWVDKWLSNPKDMILAVKKFKLPTTKSPEDRFTKEFENLTKLMNASIKSQNVMLPLASLLYGEQPYLIYDLAEMTLTKYLELPYDFRVDTTKAVLKNGTDLVGALDWIHEYNPYQSIIHGDIRPENILILKESSREIWKLADFDRSFSYSTFGNDDSGRATNEDPRSYHPPERMISRRSDVWSMACMITLILSWLSEGPQAIGEFLTMRSGSNFDEPDVFYNESKSENSDVLKPGVTAWLRKLNERASERAKAAGARTKDDQVEDLTWYSKYVEEVLHYLSDKVFVLRDHRDQAEHFYVAMDGIYSQIRNTDYVESTPSGVGRPPSLKYMSSEESEVSEYYTRRSSKLLSPGRRSPLPKTGSRRPHNSKKRQSKSDVPHLEDTTRAVTGLAEEHGNSVSPSQPTATPGPPRVYTSAPNGCRGLCSAINREPPPGDISEYTQDLNKGCSECDYLPIHKAIIRESQDWVRKLLNTGQIELEKKCQPGGTYTPLMRCCVTGRLWAAKLLLRAGCRTDIDYKSIRDREFESHIKKCIKEELKRRKQARRN